MLQLEKRSLSDKVPLIVPPLIDKSRFFQHESVRRMWAEAALHLSQATRVLAVGYSLPDTDLAFQQFLLTASQNKRRQNKKKLCVVNLECCAVDHYRELLNGGAKATLGEVFEINDNDQYVGKARSRSLWTRCAAPPSRAATAKASRACSRAGGGFRGVLLPEPTARILVSLHLRGVF